MQPEVLISWNGLGRLMKIRKFITLTTTTDAVFVQEFIILKKYTTTFNAKKTKHRHVRFNTSFLQTGRSMGKYVSILMLFNSIKTFIYDG
jgi:hypothetical protein